ncbi:MAG: sigma-70 family RNA polymerase sigma factor [Planctomycetota bacterium]
MSDRPRPDATQVLQDVSAGRSPNAEELMPLLYDEFHALAERQLAKEPKGITLQPTALVHEVFLKLVDQDRVDWKGRTHFFAIGAKAMRRILVDHARRRKRLKRGGDRSRVELDEGVALSPERDEDLLALHEALEKLEGLDERQARIVELRFFGGLTVEEVAEVLGVSKRTVEADWTVVRAWLRRELDAGEDGTEAS